MRFTLNKHRMNEMRSPAAPPKSHGHLQKPSADAPKPGTAPPLFHGPTFIGLMCGLKLDAQKQSVHRVFLSSAFTAQSKPNLLVMASLQDLQSLMGQLTINVTGLTASSQKLHEQMEATQGAQERSEAQMQKLTTQVAEQGQTLERLSTQMVGYSAGTNSPPQVGDVTMKYTGIENNASLMDKHITGLQCAQLIQHALSENVVPVVKHINHRLTDVEMELKKLKIAKTLSTHRWRMPRSHSLPGAGQPHAW